jgi:hypothetical protein
MRTEIFTLCENAEKLGDEFSITKTFCGYATPQVPYTSNPCFVVIRLRVEESEVEGENHILSMKIFDPDLRELFQMKSKPFQMRQPRETRTLSCGFLVPVPPLPFGVFGEHTINLFFDDKPLGSIPVFVCHSQ